MKKVLAIIRNDLRMHFSSFYEMIFYIVLPIIFTVIIGAGLGGNSEDTNSDNRFPIAVVDKDNSPFSSELIMALEDSEVIRPIFGTAEETKVLFDDGQVVGILTIPSKFEEQILAGERTDLDLLELPNASQVFAVEEAVRAIAAQLGSAAAAANSSVRQAEMIQPFEGPEDRQRYYDESLALAIELASEPAASVEITHAATVNPQIASGFEQSSSGQLVTWTLITLIGAAVIFVSERLEGTLSRLMTTPTHKATIILGKLSGRLVLGIIQMAILIGFGALVLKVNWANSWPALILILFAFALAATGLGTLAGTFVRTASQAAWVTIMLSMLTAALGGAWWPLEITPAAYQTAVKVLPTTWAMIGLNDVIVRGQGVEGILTEVLVLLGFAVVFYILGVWRLRFE